MLLEQCAYLNMVLEHIWFRKFFKIIDSSGPYDPGAYDAMDHKLRPKSQKKKKKKKKKAS